MSTFEAVQAAYRRLQGRAHRTPVLTSRTLDRQVDAAVLLKCENFQRTGSFKFRGAYNALSCLKAGQKRRGVLTYSSGNHAQAMALAGSLLGIGITVVMPRNAPRVKRAATGQYGARIVDYDPAENSREVLAGELQARLNLTLIPPYDHEDIIAGQGTATLEFLQQVDSLESLLVPCGGGGLLSGAALTAKTLNSRCRVVGIEPELAADATRSFRTGILHTVNNPPTIADGTRTPSLGKLTFPLIRKYVDDMQTVSEEDIKQAVRFLFQVMKLVVEPSGALGIAALLSGAVKDRARTGVIISGGNIDTGLMAAILTEQSSQPARTPDYE